ncbi:hypothetical protein IWQ57_002788 [Coemansia nantahalensis]|uniref:Uncharacterized protein n=2 Tax=Coemansia TaxID=4863 RepID=A0ACC1L8M0_9FUNG|nr:hypothetical protein IWQ57_002788 [Coemansia nantahalensis]KAJ2802919.1 hypothetical protein H4R21_002237 [Coemansia helicoidea]
MLASAVPSVITAGDLARSFANSPVLGAEGLLASSAERLPLLTDTLLPQPLPEDADSTQHGLHIRMHGPSSLSRQLSRDAHLLDTADSSDNDYDTSAPTPAMGPPPLPGAADHPFMQDSNAWESSDADSGDQIRPSHGVVLRRELGAIADFDQELLDADLDEAARLLQQGIPTCPSGCGCNCLSESYRLIA